jgi:hypothetical protein
MSRCPSCDYPLPIDRDRTGARCPRCHDPLYEPARQYGRPAREGEGACPVHAGVESVGVCGRCGNYLCEVCRTRWRNGILCAACVNRALESREGTPEQARTHFRHALAALLLGVGAWVVGVLTYIVIGVVVTSSPGPEAILLVFLGVLVLAGAVLAGALGVGQAVAALRTRGNHMILATIGLIVSGLYVGALIGLFTFNIWQS